MKRNIERVKEWLREAGIVDVELREMESQCCPFHWSDTYIEVNPKTSRRTLRKHFKKDILPNFEAKVSKEPLDVKAVVQTILLKEFIEECPGFTDYKTSRNTMSSKDVLMVHEAKLGTKLCRTQTVIEKGLIDEGKAVDLRTLLKGVYHSFNLYKGEKLT